MSSKTFTTTIYRDGSTCFIPVPFDPRPVFGRVRAPVKVTLNGFTYRSTIAAMGGPPCIGVRASHREAAGVAGGLAASIALTRYLTTMLFGVSAADPATYAGLAGVMVIVSALACYVPARRAARVDPLAAIRAE